MDGNTMRRNRARYREIVCSLDIDIQLLVTSNNNRFKVLLRGWKKITEFRMETRVGRKILLISISSKSSYIVDLEFS